MKRFTSILRERKGSQSGEGSSRSTSADSPKSTCTEAIKAFCESNTVANAGDEVTHLPTIVEGAESSPAVAAACAVQLRNLLALRSMRAVKEAKPHVQYNAIMLLRILTDNPGPSFTKNIDSKFVDVIKHLLRSSQDPSVQQILRETLNTFEVYKAKTDNNLLPVVAMWRKEKANSASHFAMMEADQARALAMTGPGGHRNRGRSHRLPPPEELAGRVEEARTSAKLLIQLVQSTPASEIAGHDLIREFAERCQSAQRSMQGYMNATEPHAPDPDTFQTLIETCEQLNVASSKHQRAMLAVRRSGSGTPAVVSPPPQAAPEQGVNGNAVNDPFSDENRIPDTVAPSTFGAYPQQTPPQNQPYSNAYAASTLGATAAQQQAALDAARARTFVNQAAYSPPAGPPPGQSLQSGEKPKVSTLAQEVADDDDDDDLYGPPSAKPAAVSTNGTAAGTGASSHAEPRIKDDDPMPSSPLKATGNQGA